MQTTEARNEFDGIIVRFELAALFLLGRKTVLLYQPRYVQCLHYSFLGETSNLRHVTKAKRGHQRHFVSVAPTSRLEENGGMSRIAALATGQ